MSTTAAMAAIMAVRATTTASTELATTIAVDCCYFQDFDGSMSWWVPMLVGDTMLTKTVVTFNVSVAVAFEVDLSTLSIYS